MSTMKETASLMADSAGMALAIGSNRSAAEEIVSGMDQEELWGFTAAALKVISMLSEKHPGELEKMIGDLRRHAE